MESASVSVECICAVRCCLSSCAPRWISGWILFPQSRQLQWRFHMAALKREKMMKQKKKGFINLLESVRSICKGKLIPTNFLFLLLHFFPPWMHGSDALPLMLFLHCFPPDRLHWHYLPQAISKPLKPLMGDFLQHQLFIGNPCRAAKVHTVPSIIREGEQCAGVNTNSGRGWISVHFSNPAVHLSSAKPQERLLPPRSLIKQERINNRCLGKGRLWLSKRKVP